MEARVATTGTGGIFHIEVDGADATGALIVPGTGGWQTWRSIALDGIPADRRPSRVESGFRLERHDRLDGQLQLDALDSVGCPAMCRRRFRSSRQAMARASRRRRRSTSPATASDPDGTITQVAFYAGNTLLGIDTIAPYTLTWSLVPIGDYVDHGARDRQRRRKRRHGADYRPRGGGDQSHAVWRRARRHPGPDRSREFRRRWRRRRLPRLEDREPGRAIPADRRGHREHAGCRWRLLDRLRDARASG